MKGLELMNGGGGVKVVNSRLRSHKTHGKPRGGQKKSAGPDDGSR